MSWNLEGKRVTGVYLGLWPFSGLVTESRVKYGAQVQHTVQVDTPFTAYGSERDVVLVRDTEINCVSSHVETNDNWYDDQFEVDFD